MIFHMKFGKNQELLKIRNFRKIRNYQENQDVLSGLLRYQIVL